MQAIIVTKDTLFSEAVTCAMLREMAAKLFEMSEEDITKLASEPLTKGTKHIKDLTCAKLRTVLATKLANSPDDEFGGLWANGELEVEFNHLPDLDLNINKAGANTKSASSGGAKSKLSGEYHVVKVVPQDKDAGKQEIWQHVWSCTSFEDFFAKSPVKGATTATNRVISASSEIGYAVKVGWIKVGPKPVAA